MVIVVFVIAGTFARTFAVHCASSRTGINCVLMPVPPRPIQELLENKERVVCCVLPTMLTALP